MMPNDDMYYKEHETDQIWWLQNDDVIGELWFTFDKTVKYNMFRDFPHELSKRQVEIFVREQPYWTVYFRDRLEAMYPKDSKKWIKAAERLNEKEKTERMRLVRETEILIMDMIDSRKPYEWIDEDGRSGVMIITHHREDDGQLTGIAIRFPDGPAHGEQITCDWDDFVNSEWKPSDIPESEWKQYLSDKEDKNM